MYPEISNPTDKSATFYELSHPQKRILFSEEIYPNTSGQSLIVSFVLEKEYEPSVLSKAINLVLKHTEGLQFRITKRQYDIQQYPYPVEDKNWEFLDFNGNEKKLQNWLREKAQEPIPVYDSCLYEFSIYKDSTANICILLKAHHLILDAFSWALIIDRILQAYNSLVSQTPYTPLQAKYSSYIESESLYKRSENYELDKEFWLNKFNNISSNTQLFNGEVQSLSPRSRRKKYIFTAKESSRILGLIKETNSSIFKLFLSLSYTIFHKISHKETLVLGAPLHNRFLDANREVIGMFVNMIPFKLSTDGNSSFENLLDRVKVELQENIRHQDYPYDVFIKDLREVNNQQQSPELFDCVINYQNASYAEGVKRVDWHHTGYSNYPLTLHISKRGDNNSLILEIDYQTSRFLELEIDLLFQFYQKLLHQISEKPGIKIAELELGLTDSTELLEKANILLPQTLEKERLILSYCTRGKDTAKNNSDKNILLHQREKEKTFWSQVFDSHHTSFFDTPKSDLRGKQFKEKSLSLPPQIAEKLISMSNDSDQRLHVILSTSVLLLFHKYTQHRQIGIATSLFSQSSYENLLNTCLPLFCSIKADDSLKGLLLKVIKNLNLAMEHQNYPIEYFLSQTLEENTALDSSFDIKIYLENIQKVDIAQYAGAALNLYFNRQDSDIQCKISYDTEMLEEESLDKLIQNLNAIFEHLVEDVNKTVSEIRLPHFNRYTFCLAGSGAVASSCAELLVKQNHKISCIISDNDKLASFANEHNISYLRIDEKDLQKQMDAVPYDFLLSLEDQRQSEAFKFSGKKLKYHDSLLPEYPGYFATTKALMNQEKVHGVSWYFLDEDNQRELCQQASFNLTPEETSYSLNLKSLNYVLASFKELLEALESDALETELLQLDQRELEDKNCRPKAAGIISFNSPAEQISAFVRSLDFKHYENPISTAKIFIEDHLFVPGEINVLDEASGEEAGTILRIEEEHVVISSTDFDLQISGYQPLTGAEVEDLFLYEGMNLEYPLEKREQVELIHQKISQQEDFWIGSLTNITPLSLGLALDTNNSTKANQINSLAFKLPELQNLPHTSSQEKSDLALSVFLAFLYRTTGNESFAIQYQDSSLSTLTSGFENLFADYVPLKIQAKPSLNFDAFVNIAMAQLQHVRKAVSFQKDIFYRYEQLAALRSSGQNFSNIKVSLVADVEALIQTDPQDLLHLCIDEKGAAMRLFFNEKNIQAEFVNDIVSQIKSFYKNLRKEPELPLIHLSVLNKAEQENILLAFNDAAAKFSTEKTLNQLFEEAVLVHKDRRALAFEEKELSYSELNKRANQCAHTLLEQGIRPGENVAILAQRSMEMVVAILGVLKAGAVYIPIDLSQPLNRINQIIDSVQPQYAVIYGLDSKSLESIARANASIESFLDLEADSPNNQVSLPLISLKQIQTEAETNPEQIATSDDIAYVIHTSGSTGVPKGVIVKHRPVINVIEWLNRKYKVSPEDRLLFITSIGFDLSVYDIFGILAAGASLQIAKKEEIQDPRVLAELIPKYSISIWDSTPGTLNQTLPYLAEIAEKSQHFRLSMLSGDWIPLSLPPALKKLFKEMQVLAMGGATEATIWSNYFDVEALDPAWKSVPYGKPIQNCKYYIFDSHMNVCPIHVEGDLYIGGECVAEGYLNRPELTHDRFIDNPHAQGEKIYKTGDRARWYKDGNMEFLGRVDHQIKLRGYRVELGEIESQMIKYSGVESAVILVKTLKDDDKRLFAYYTASEEIEPALFKDYLKDRLPSYMIPAQLIQIDQIPITAIGKVDRKALMAIENPAYETEDFEYSELSDIGKGVMEIWKEALGVKNIRLSDNFFELGGHSFLVIQVSNMMEGAFGKEPRFVNFTNRSLEEFIKNYEAEFG